MTLEDEAEAELRELGVTNRLRVPRVLEGPQGPRAIVDGAEVTSFASNDYLGLAGDSRIARAAASSLDDDGVGAGASRLIVGNHRQHVALEAAVGTWLARDGVRLFNSGYAANVGVITTLARRGDVVFSDELNHASIVDGCRLARAEVVVFAHRDLAALEQQLQARRGARRLVISESLFSMDGDIADVAALSALCRRHDAALILDEAHACGVFGPEGRGIAAAAGVVPDVVIGTFGKAFGTFGAFAASSRAVADLLWNRARPLVFSTGLPPSIAAATTRALEIVRGTEGDDLRRTLATRARRLREQLPIAGGASDSAIAPVLVGDDREVMEQTARLFAEGIYVQGIRPPTVPVGTARLRISLCARHTPADVDKAARAIAAVVAR